MITEVQCTFFDAARRNDRIERPVMGRMGFLLRDRPLSPSLVHSVVTNIGPNISWTLDVIHAD